MLGIVKCVFYLFYLIFIFGQNSKWMDATNELYADYI